MRKTFSNVCRCETRTSQTRPSQQADDNETSAWSVSIYLIYKYIVRSGVGYERCLSCVKGAMRRPVSPGWAEKQTPTPFLYHKLT